VKRSGWGSEGCTWVVKAGKEERTEEKSEDLKDKFHEELESVYDILPLHCVDIRWYEQKVGKELMNRLVVEPDSLHDVSNENETRLINFAYFKDFMISSTYFPKKIYINTHENLQIEGHIIKLTTYRTYQIYRIHQKI